MRLNTISKRIIFSFGFVAMTLAGSGILAVALSSRLQAISLLVRDVRVPTVENSLVILNGVNATQSVLKSWILLQSGTYREERASLWSSEILPAAEELGDLAPQWTDSADRELLKRVREKMSILGELQAKAERTTMASSIQAVRAMENDLMPLTKQIRAELRELIRRKNLLMDGDLRLQAEMIHQLKLIETLLIIIGMGASGIMAFFLFRSISRPIHQTIEFADIVASGQYDQKISISGSEEINRLGQALERMRASLFKSSWLSHAQLKLNESVRTSSNLRELSDRTSATISRLLDADIAALHLVEDGRLKSIGGFAVPEERLAGKERPIGEGFVGQAAHEGSIVRVSGINENSMKLSTVAGDFVPSELTAAPMTYQDRVVGVLELASSKPFEDTHMEFLGIATDVVAIALNSTQKGEQIKNLLHETQAQAEELQTQQEELRATNEELQTRQEELESTNEELEEQKSLLESQKQTLDRVSHYKSEFLANMSHELRTPLNSQLILSQILEENKEGNLTAKQKEFARTIHGTGLELLQLINDILDLSKVEAGKMDLDVFDCSIKQIVLDCEKTFRPQVQKKGLELTVKVDSDLPRVIRTDGHRLSQILKNFMSNAIKFTSKGEVRVEAGRPTAEEIKNSKLRASAENAVAFRVVDSGIGISSDKLQKIFQAFEQVDSSVSRKYGGTGLGLAICKKLAELLGGDVAVSSTPGTGSCFTLLLPLAGVAETAQVNSSPETTSTLLMVEDNSQFGAVMKEILEGSGVQCELIETGKAALTYLSQHQPFGILLDGHLPDMEGVDLLKQLKSDPKMMHIPVYMLSGDQAGEEGVNHGALGSLPKPATAQQILETVEKLRAASRPATRRALVVEDEKMQADRIAELLKPIYVETVRAESAEEAHKLLREAGPFDLMILDFHLPDMNGLDFLTSVHFQENMVVPPTIVHTARDLTREEEECIRRNSASVIIKGTRSNERMLEEVKLILGGRGHRVGVAAKNPKKIFAAEAPFKNKHVLIVDDDVRNIFALSNALQEKGLTVSYAHNGQEALDAFGEGKAKFDLVLMDIMMPVMDGYEAMRQLRKKKDVSQIPIIALTAKAMKGDRETCIAAGANDYLSKPIDMNKLLALLRVWLSK